MASGTHQDDPRMYPSPRRSYPEDLHYQAWQPPRPESRALVKIDQMEGRLGRQEKTTHELVTRAYKIKEDLLDNLNLTQSAWEDEKRAREILEQRVRSLASAIKKMSTELQQMDNHIRLKGNVQEGTQNAVKNLEMQQMTGLGDIRGRVGRCDSSIAKVKAEVRSCFDSMNNISKQHASQSARLEEKLQLQDAKINELVVKLDKFSAQQEIHLRHIEGDTNQQLTGLDTRTRGLIEDMKNHITSIKILEEAEREKLEARLQSHLERNSTTRDTATERLEKNFGDALNSLNTRLEQVEHQTRGDRFSTALQSLESKLNKLIESHNRRQQTDVSRLKRECREGFGTVQETITSMKDILEGRNKLLEEQLKKEIGQIRKMVVLI